MILREGVVVLFSAHVRKHGGKTPASTHKPGSQQQKTHDDFHAKRPRDVQRDFIRHRQLPVPTEISNVGIRYHLI